MTNNSQFPQISEERFLKIQLATTIIAWLGFVLNGILISAILSSWQMFGKRPGRTKMLICGQALPDLLLGAVIAPVGVYIHQYQRFPGKATLLKYWHQKRMFWHGNVCSFYGFACHFLVCASVMNMCLITWDRYCVISKPFGGRLPEKKLFQYYLSTWIVASFYAPAAFLQSGFVLSASRTECYGLTGPGFESTLTTLLICMCVSFCVVCYVKMYWIIQKSSKSLSSITSQSIQEIKVAKQFFSIVACFVLCLGVSGFSWFVGMTGLGLHSHFFGWVEILGFQFATLNSVFNPLLCFLLFQDIRKAVFRLFVPQLLSKSQNSTLENKNRRCLGQTVVVHVQIKNTRVLSCSTSME